AETRDRRDRWRRLNVVDGDREGIGLVGEGAVLVGQVDGDGPVGRAVGVGVGRAEGAGGVVVEQAVAPVDLDVGDRVRARIDDRAEGQGVEAALVDARRTADGQGRLDVVDGDGCAV